MDLHDPATDPVLAARDWRWFLVRFRGLLNNPDTRLHAAMSDTTPDTPPPPAPAPA